MAGRLRVLQKIVSLFYYRMWRSLLLLLLSFLGLGIGGARGFTFHTKKSHISGQIEWSPEQALSVQFRFRTLQYNAFLFTISEDVPQSTNR